MANPWYIQKLERLKQSPLPDLGDPPDIIREWAEKVIQSWDLSPREREVLDVLLKGCTDEEIAQALGISSKSVKHHMWAIRAKSRTESRAEIFAEILRL